MKNLKRSIFALFIGLGVLTTSCDQSMTEDMASLDENSDITIDEITSAIETISINYDITTVNNDDSEEVISNDTELEANSKRNGKVRIVFPIQVTVDGETITINNKKEMKALISKKKKSHKRLPFHLVFPVTVSTADGDLILEDKESYKAYRESLEEGIKPEYVFPISVIYKGETMVINSIEELKALKPTKGKGAKPALVFPVTVVTADGNLEIADQEAMKAYRETLEEGERPTYVFPISLIVDGETVTVNNEDELKALRPERDKKGHHANRPKLVFPLSVVTPEGNLEIADKEAMKAYVETLAEGEKPTFVFPISVIVDEETIVVNSQEEWDALKPNKSEE